MNDEPLDEPPGFRSERINRLFGRIVYQVRDFGSPDSGGTGQYQYRPPILFLNHLYRSGHLVYYPGGNGGICGINHDSR